MKFSQLSEEAKNTARRYAEPEHEWWDSVYEDFLVVADHLGFSTSARYIQFSGFWSQGDGACFRGTYSGAKQHQPAIKAHAPEDEELHRIAGQLDALSVGAKLAYNSHWEGSIQRMGRGANSGCMYLDWGDLHQTFIGTLSDEACKHASDTILQAAKDLAGWLYKQLQAEYEWLTSDECLEQYEYNEEGCTI